MKAVKATLDARGVGLLEMPPAAGKTSLMLAVVMAYQGLHNYPQKVVFCSKSVEESQRAMEELKKTAAASQATVFALNFSCKKNLCLNPSVKNAGTRLQVESKCLDLTAPWLERACSCPYYAKYREVHKQWRLQPGIYTCSDVKQICEDAGLCPYFVQKQYLGAASIVMCSYQYVFNPKLSPEFLESLPQDSLIVFDDADSIDQVCIEMRSLSLNRETLNKAFNCMRTLKARHEAAKASDDLVEDLSIRDLPLSLRLQAERRDDLLINPVVSADILDEAVPGNLRRGEHFLSFLKRVLVFFRKQMKSQEAKINSPDGLLYLFKASAFIDQDTLKHVSSRLHAFLTTLRVTNLEEFLPLIAVCDLCTLLATNSKGYALILEPYPESPTEFDPVLQFTCLDAAPIFQSVVKNFSSVLLASHQLTPFDYYGRLLDITPAVTSSIDQLCSSKICPVILTRGSDQLAVSSSIEDHDDDAIMRNYGDLLVELADTVPDGIVCFFPSYKFMEDVILKWNETGLLNRLLEYKLVFFQSKDPQETQLAIYNFKLACNAGRGAILVMEGSPLMKFPGHYARCLVVFGVPFQNTLSRFIKARLTYLKEHKGFDERDFLNFDAMRQAAHCASSALSVYQDYAVLVFADKRFALPEKRDRLPGWISKALQKRYSNLSTDMLVSVARTFLQSVTD
jgi:DNA excision repair protein ERCC-2